MGQTDTPGRFTSETGRWYFACDTDKGVLVGITGQNSADNWTCPVLGLHRVDFDETPEGMRNLLALECASERLYGYEDGPKIIKVPLWAWKDFSGEDLEADGEWGSGIRTEPPDPGDYSPPIRHVIVVLSECCALRLHVAYE